MTPASRTRRAQAATGRPVALVIWERRERERFNAWLAQYGLSARISRDDVLDFRKDGQALFFFAYQQLSPVERLAEAERLNAAIEANPHDESARSDARLWDFHVRAWRSERISQRGKAERQAIKDAEAVLRRCTYLGGYPCWRRKRRRCDALIGVGPWGSIAFATRTESAVCTLPWSEITGVRAFAIEDAPAIPRAGWPWRMTARLRPEAESAILITTTNGDAYFLIRGFDSRQAQSKLDGLTKCLDQPTAESYREMSTGIRQQLIR